MAKLTAYKSLRLLLILLFVFAGSQLVAQAQSFEVDYGKELKAVPYDLRVSYINKTGKPWSEATYQQRYDFLYDRYQKQLAADVKKQAEDADRQLKESNKQMNRDMQKQSEIQKQVDKDMRKLNDKIAEQNKKNARYLKSLEQKQKLLNLRQSSMAQKH